MTDTEDEEDYVSYGTPLDPLDEDALPRKKPFSLEDQVATDKQGRRRFHGAFTGGFSAGFFNSVGSLEGWTPSTFKSSRSGKADSKTQKPEDFMDDEDMEEHGIAPKVLRATADYSDKKGKKRERPHQSDGPIPGKPVLEEIIQPARDTVGIKLLKRMGWKPGQGVGPRLTGAEKRRSKLERQKAAGRVYGCLRPDFIQPPSQTDKEDESSDDDDDITFAPDDLEPFLCQTKDNYFGIAYVGLDKRPVLSSHFNLFEPSLLNITDKQKKVSISGQAFGVGAFEEEDADIYAKDDMSQYDFALESTSKTTSNKTRKQRWSSGNDMNHLTACIEGFVISSEPIVRKKFFSPPALPRDFQPVHVARKSRFEPAPQKDDSTEVSSKKKGLERHSLTAEDRSLIIGEPMTTVEKQPTKEVLPNVSVEHSSSLTSTDALGNSRFRPFVACPEKQQRYEQFLSIEKLPQKDGLSKLQPLSMTEWEREHERMEFEQAARLYRPMTGIMSDRFVSATQPDDATNPLATVERTKSDADKDMAEAAKMKMFGRLTRQRTEWRPTSLLCKRFNIPELFPGSASSESQKKPYRFSVFDYLDAAQQNSSVASLPEPEVKQPLILMPKLSSGQQESTAETSGDKEKEQHTPDASRESEISEKPVNLEFPDLPEKVDLFKAIFLSSSDESDSEDESRIESEVKPDSLSKPIATAETPDVEVPVTPTKPPPESFNNTLRNTSPPRGIFANLNLDAINARKQVVPESVIVNVIEPEMPVKQESVVDTDLAEGVFGPPLPSGLHIPSQSASASRISPVEILSSVVVSDSRWVEKPCKHPRKEKRSSKKSHKKDKKVSKHKKHKDKHKKKHKHKK